MARRFLTSIDLLGFALQNAMLHPVSSDPSGLGTGDAGRIWFNTTTSKLMVWSGTAAIDLLNRANHSGSITASVISDFNTAVRTNRLDQLAAPTAAVALGGQKITGLADGTAGTDAVTYGQLLQFLNNQAFKAPVRVATTANITLSGTQTIDGVAVVAGDRVLAKDQTSAATNGVYVVAAGAWSRADDMNTSAEAVPGSVFSVQEGTANGDKLFMLATNGPITLGTTNLVISAYGASSGEIGVAGAGLTKTGSTYDVGAGTGIVVGADTVGIDTTIVGRKVTGTIPATSSGIFTVSGANVTINHALGNAAAKLEAVYGAAGTSPGQPVELEYTNTDANNIAAALPGAPAANVYIISVVG